MSVPSAGVPTSQRNAVEIRPIENSRYVFTSEKCIVSSLWLFMQVEQVYIDIPDNTGYFSSNPLRSSTADGAAIVAAGC